MALVDIDPLLQTFPRSQRLLSHRHRTQVQIQVCNKDRSLCSIADQHSTAENPPQPAAPKASSGGPRPSRKQPARKFGTQSTVLEAVDGTLDPLGPLGGDASIPTASAPVDQGPTPPRKEPGGARGGRPDSSGVRPTGPLPGAGAELEEDGALTNRQRGPPAVQPTAGGAARQTQPSMSIEQAAKPSFKITVGDPHKVGDITSSHIVYQVRTKVRKCCGD